MANRFADLAFTRLCSRAMSLGEETVEVRMRILVTGATGTVGRHVVGHLAGAGVDVRALTRRPETAGLPGGPAGAEQETPVAVTFVDSRGFRRPG